MFDTFIVQPIFNLLALIYALLPGHNFGLAIIIFTIIIRLLLWPLVKKQLHQTKLMRRIQPELKQIAKDAKGDKQKRALMQMELYKEKGINPFGTIGVALLQLPILFGLYIGLQKVSKDANQMVDFAYPAVQNLPFMKQLAGNINLFDSSLFGIVDLHRAALSSGSIYIPALIIVIASVVIQYFQAKQLLPNDKDARGLRAILKDASSGKEADQAEVGAAVGRGTVYLLPGMIFIFTIGIASALSLYWLIGGLVAFIQQSIVLREDTDDMQKLSESSVNKKDVKVIPEAEIIETSPASKAALQKASRQKQKASRNKKRRKR